MLDKRLFLIIGTPLCDASVTIMAENIFDLKDIPDAVARFGKEREGWWKIMSDKIEQQPKKRSAKSLMDATPSKKRCMSV